MATRFGIIVNPTAGRRRTAGLASQALSELGRRGLDLHDLSADSAAAAEERARTAIADGAIDALIVLGGDGMVHLGTNLVAGTGVPLGVVALGTGNDNARESGLPVRDPLAAVETIAAGRTRQVDAIRHTGGERPRWFLGVLAAGFDAVVNERANRMRWPHGPMRYNLATLRELPVFRAIPYVLEIDGRRVETSAMLVALGNGPAYGGGMQVVPQASMDDGLMDLLILHQIAVPEFLRVFPRVFSGGHADHPAVEIIRCRTVTMQAPGIVAYADGERFAPLPLACEVVPGAVTLFT